ncbi:MAG: hypothetical protein V1690_01940 [Candidatus Moraniibacteriota bacterium]
MKIMICGSMTFAKEMLEAKKKLEKMGHEVRITQPVILSGNLSEID